VSRIAEAPELKCCPRFMPDPRAEPTLGTPYPFKSRCFWYVCRRGGRRGLSQRRDKRHKVMARAGKGARWGDAIVAARFLGCVCYVCAQTAQREGSAFSESCVFNKFSKINRDEGFESHPLRQIM